MSVDMQRSRALHILPVWTDFFLALGLLVTVGTYQSISQHGADLLIILISALASLGYFLGCAIACATWVKRHRWARASISAVKAVAFVFLSGPCLMAGDYVHLASSYPMYRKEIEARGAENTTPVRFDWGDKALWALDGFQGETLVYDPTDALAASVNEIRQGNRREFSVSTRHLAGHFYVEHESSN